ncbi:hypothetical protein [Salipiger bermudensis]|uniref:hypothetical protein n=1 Tax=Salipiger bermudensis TaxID=344736 RepID=UPI003514C564
MFVLGIIASFAAIAAMCWLVFNLAVFALPFLVGLHTGIWAYGTGAGWLGAILVGGFAAGLSLAVGQALIMLVRPLWARFVIALIFVVPAVLAGFYATLGITRTMMPSETWQMIFGVIGAGVVGVSPSSALPAWPPTLRTDRPSAPDTANDSMRRDRISAGMPSRSSGCRYGAVRGSACGPRRDPWPCGGRGGPFERQTAPVIGWDTPAEAHGERRAWPVAGERTRR